jgi:hypothetical protein
VLANPGVAGALVSLAKERAQACWRSASVRDPRRFSDRRTGDTFIDARKQLQQNITIRSVPTTNNARAGRGGVEGLPPPAAVQLGVPTSGVVPTSHVVPTSGVATGQEIADVSWVDVGGVPVPGFENLEFGE